jgi:hypothetical protein
MPRITFTDKDGFLTWIKDHVTPSQYEVYVTSYAEIIVAPTKSTKTLRYAFIEVYKAWEDSENAINDIRKKVPGVKFYQIEKFDWDSERSISVKQNP